MATRYKIGDYVVLVNKDYSHLKGLYRETGKVVDIAKSKVDRATVYFVKFPKDVSSIALSASDVRKR